jgi:hypothetical protein
MLHREKDYEILTVRDWHELPTTYPNPPSELRAVRNINGVKLSSGIAICLINVVARQITSDSISLVA